MDRDELEEKRDQLRKRVLSLGQMETKYGTAGMGDAEYRARIRKNEVQQELEDVLGLLEATDDA